MVTQEKWIYLPIETKSREYKGKLLLACFLAENDFRVIIGDRSELYDKLIWFPKGIFLEKEINHSTKSKFSYNKKLGNEMVVSREEGLIFSKKREKRLFDKDNFKMTEKYFAWGKNEYEFINKIIENGSEKIKLTGNVRFDLLRPELRHIFDDDLILSKYSPYILINTSFALYTHFTGGESYLDSYIDSYIDNLEWKQQKTKENLINYVKERFNYNKNMYEKFIKMIKYLAEKHEDCNIIVRPHPSASKNKYKEELKNYENIYVIKKGNANKWIKNSSFVIHNNCTTGVEAFLMNKPVISYRPITSSKFDSYLPNALSKQINDKEELSKKIRLILDGKCTVEKDAKKINIAKEYIANVDNKKASKVITEELKNINMQKEKFDLVSKMVQSCFSYPKKTAENIIDFIIKRENEYHKSKFPGIDLEEINDDIKTFEKSLKELNDIKSKKIFQDIFMIYK